MEKQMEMASETTQNSALRTDEAASHGPLWRLIDCAVTAHANRAKVPVNRKAYLRWCLLGVFGAQLSHHDVIQKAYQIGNGILQDHGNSQ